MYSAGVCSSAFAISSGVYRVGFLRFCCCCASHGSYKEEKNKETGTRNTTGRTFFFSFSFYFQSLYVYTIIYLFCFFLSSLFLVVVMLCAVSVIYKPAPRAYNFLTFTSLVVSGCALRSECGCVRCLLV